MSPPGWRGGRRWRCGVTKQALNQEAAMDLVSAIEWEARAQADCMQNPNFREAYEAFRAKREPKFE